MQAENRIGESEYVLGLMPLIWKIITMLMQMPFAKSIYGILSFMTLYMLFPAFRMMSLYFSFRPVLAVEVAVADGFGDMA